MIGSIKAVNVSSIQIHSILKAQEKRIHRTMGDTLLWQGNVYFDVRPKNDTLI